MSEVEPLSAFLKRTAESPARPFLAALRKKAQEFGVTDFDAATELARMRAYIAQFYQGVQPLHSFAPVAGLVIDCVPFEQQPAARSARAVGHDLLTIAPPPAAVPDLEPSAATGQGSTPPQRPCPPGTVPIRRITLDHLVSFGTLDHYFRKTPPAAPG